MLIEHSFEQAVRLGYDVVVILGSPMNYVGCGFKKQQEIEYLYGKWEISGCDDGEGTGPESIGRQKMVLL